MSKLKSYRSCWISLGCPEGETTTISELQEELSDFLYYAPPIRLETLTMKCPVCRATYRSSGVREQGLGSWEMPIPHRDLLPDTLNVTAVGLISRRSFTFTTGQSGITDRQFRHFKQGYPAATTWNNQALALYVNNAFSCPGRTTLGTARRVSAGARRLGKARHPPSTGPICKG